MNAIEINEDMVTVECVVDGTEFQLDVIEHHQVLVTTAPGATPLLVCSFDCHMEYDEKGMGFPV